MTVSLVDVGGPVAFVRAADLGLNPLLEPAAANANADLLDRLEAVRGACAVLAGLAGSCAEAYAASPALPRLALVGDGDQAHDSHLSLRVLSMQRVHHACPITVLICAAAAAMMPGTVASAVSWPHGAGLRRGRDRQDATILVAHPKGVAAATVRLGAGSAVHSVSITRTARRLLTGEACL